MRVDALAARLRESGHEHVPLLVVRLPELERVAWRRGLRAARTIERRAGAAFSIAVAAALRAEDVAAHDPGSDVFVAALLAPTRDGTGLATVDARAALVRIAATMETATRLDVLTGWTACEIASELAAMDDVIARALARGVQERERYAFFSALGHELRTPLSSIRGYLETLLDDDVDRTTRLRFVRIAHNESLRLSRLIEGMFEISLLDLHANFSVRAHAELASVLEAAHDACASSAAARGVRVTVAVPEHPVAVAMEADRLALVVINLIDNAVKHGRSDGTVRVSVDLADRRFARVLVDDDGPGIAPSRRERIFALGERGATTAAGTGIGLALARLMLERVGGRVDAHGSPLGGARFVLAVPRRDD